MNPVDYLFAAPTNKDLSKDTIRRALGQRLIPSLQSWQREVIGAGGYSYQYGNRRYAIVSRTGRGLNARNKNVFYKYYIVLVTPGVFGDVGSITESGHEIADPNGLSAEPARYRSASLATESADKHARIYG